MHNVPIWSDTTEFWFSNFKVCLNLLGHYVSRVNKKILGYLKKIFCRPLIPLPNLLKCDGELKEKKVKHVHNAFSLKGFDFPNSFTNYKKCNQLVLRYMDTLFHSCTLVWNIMSKISIFLLGLYHSPSEVRPAGSVRKLCYWVAYPFKFPLRKLLCWNFQFISVNKNSYKIWQVRY